jgi:hypothetical protein
VEDRNIDIIIIIIIIIIINDDDVEWIIYVPFILSGTIHWNPAATNITVGILFDPFQ